MRRMVFLCFRFGYDLIHTRSLRFFSSILNFQHSNGHRLVTESNGDHIAYLNVIGRFCTLSVNRYAFTVTCLVCDGTPFDKSGYL